MPVGLLATIPVCSYLCALSQLIQPKLTNSPQKAPSTAVQASIPPSGGGPSAAAGDGPTEASDFSGSRDSVTFCASDRRPPFSRSLTLGSPVAEVESADSGVLVVVL